MEKTQASINTSDFGKALDMRERKNAARARIKLITKSLTAEYKQNASAEIVRKCAESREFAAACSIFVYISMDGEPVTTELIRAAFAAGKTVYVPRCLGQGIMEAVKIDSFDCLKPGHYGILEPDDALLPTAVSEFDAADTVAFIPCVAASRDGRRLGHGAGYYDRFLEGRLMKKFMLVYGRQLTDDIPCDEHDITMDRVICELPD